MHQPRYCCVVSCQILLLGLRWGIVESRRNANAMLFLVFGVVHDVQGCLTAMAVPLYEHLRQMFVRRCTLFSPYFADSLYSQHPRERRRPLAGRNSVPSRHGERGKSVHRQSQDVSRSGGGDEGRSVKALASKFTGRRYNRRALSLHQDSGCHFPRFVETLDVLGTRHFGRRAQV